MFHSKCNPIQVGSGWLCRLLLYKPYLGYAGGGGGVHPIFFLHISSSWVKIRLHTENELPVMSGSVIKVLLGGWGGGVVVPLITLSTPTLVEVELG